MGKLDYDHGLLYIVKGTTQSFNLHSSARLTEETKARHSGRNGVVCGIQVSIDAVSTTISSGLLGLGSETVILEHVLKVTGHQKQKGDEFALVHWFYSSREPESNELPCHIHQIGFIVLDSADEEIIEDGEPRIRLGDRMLIPEGLGDTRTPGNPEQVFYRLALYLIDRSGSIVEDFMRALRQSRGGRIDWSKLSSLLGPEPQSRLSYFEANNKILQKIHECFLSGQVTYTHINDLLHATDSIIQKREREFEKFSKHATFNKKSHQHAIDFWKNNRKRLVSLLHYVDIQSEIRKNDSAIILDDFAIGITDTEFIKQSSLWNYAEDMIARLIIPAFLLIIVWYFWSR